MNSKSLFAAFTRSVPPFNACFETGFAVAREEADAVEVGAIGVGQPV